MTTLRVSSLRAGPRQATLQVSRLSATGTKSTTATLRVSKLTATGTTATGARLRVSSLRAHAQSALIVSAIPARTVEPFTTVSIAASAAVGTAASWSWRQVSGPSLILSTSGEHVSFTAPAQLSPVTIILGVTATDASGTHSTEVQTQVTVLAHTFWVAGDTQWIPVYLAPIVATAPTPPITPPVTTPPVSAAPYPTPTTLYTNTLSVNGAPPGFAIVTTGSVSQSAAISSGALSVNSGTGAYNQGSIRASLLSGTPKASSVEIRTDIGFTSLIEQYHSLTFGGDGVNYWPSGSGAGLPRNGYRLKFVVAANRIDVEQAYDGTVVGSVPWTFTAITATGAPNVSLRWRMEGANLRLRVWAQGTTEPSTWSLTVSKGRTDQSQGYLEFVPATGAATTAVVARLANLSLTNLFGTATQAVAMPTGATVSNGKTWNPVFAEDFLVSSSSPRDSGHALLYELYDDNTANGQYRDANVTYSASCLRLLMRTLPNLAGTAVPSGAAGVLFGQPFTGGRFSMRFRADTTMPTYGTAMMLFPAPSPGYGGGNWDEGEVDYPEGNFSPSDGPHINQHILNGTPNSDGSRNDTATTYNTGGPVALWSDWHISVIEWLPGVSLRYYLDGIMLWEETTSANVPTTPHNWVVQAAAPVGSTPSTSETGVVQIDWVTVQAISSTASTVPAAGYGNNYGTTYGG